MLQYEPYCWNFCFKESIKFETLIGVYLRTIDALEKAIKEKIVITDELVALTASILQDLNNYYITNNVQIVSVLQLRI